MLERLPQASVWLQLIISFLLFLGIYGIGKRLFTWVYSVAKREQVETKAPLLKWPWLLFCLGCFLTLVLFYLGLDNLWPEGYEFGRDIHGLFQASWAKLFILVILVMVAWPMIGVITRRIDRKTPTTRQYIRTNTIKGVIENTLKIILVMVAFVLGLQLFGFNPTSLLAGLGIVGLAISFGAQNLVRDFLNGFFVLLEDQYGVGDRITINGGGLTGDVEQLNLRVTVLRNRHSGALHIIPNGEIKTVSVDRKGRNWNRVEALARLSYEDDFEKGIEVFNKVCMDLYQEDYWGQLFVDEPILQGVERLDRDEIILRTLFTVRPTKQGQIRREYNKRVKLAFDAAGLNINPAGTLRVYDSSDNQEVDDDQTPRIDN